MTSADETRRREKEQDGRGAAGEGKPKKGQCHEAVFLRREKGPNAFGSGHGRVVAIWCGHIIHVGD